MDIVFTVIHVAAAVFIAGPIAIVPMTSLRALRTGDLERAAASAKVIRLLSYLSLIIVITGFGLVGIADPKYHLTVTTPWVLASVVLYVIAVGLTLVLVVPAFQHPEKRGVGASYARAAAGSGIATIALLAVVVLMVWKP